MSDKIILPNGMELKYPDDTIDTKWLMEEKLFPLGSKLIKKNKCWTFTVELEEEES